MLALPHFARTRTPQEWGGRDVLGLTWHFGVIALCATALSCSEPEAGPARPQVRDSAGVRIVSHDLRGVPLPVLHSAGAYDLEVGVADGAAEYSFSSIVDLALTPDGGFVVADGGSHELRVFGPDGRHAVSMGREGEGPGEFVSPPLIAGMAGDTVFAYDPGSGRATGFLPGGRLLESVALESGGGNRILTAHRLRDGSYLALSPWTAPDRVTEVHGPRLELDSLVVERLSDTGRPIDTVLVIAHRTRLRAVQERGGSLGVIQADPPYLPQAFVESGGGLVVSGNSRSFELALRAAGGLTTRLRVQGVDHPAGAAEIRTHQENRLRAEFGDEPLDPRIRQLYLDHLPARLPAFAAVSISPDRDVWVARSELDDTSGAEWLVFSSEGQLQGSVRTPPGVRLLAVGPDFIIGSVVNALDVPFVRRYPLRPPADE